MINQSIIYGRTVIKIQTALRLQFNEIFATRKYNDFFDYIIF